MTAVLSRFGELQRWPVYVAAALCVALAAARRSSPRDRATLALAGGIVVWVAIEIAFGLHGWPALGRYMFEPAAVATVLAGAFLGRVLAADWARRSRRGSAESLATFADPSRPKSPNFRVRRATSGALPGGSHVSERSALRCWSSRSSRRWSPPPCRPCAASART